MGFIPISIDEYVKKHMQNNPSENEKDLRQRLQAAQRSYQNSDKCSCGNDIWVIGSASTGNGCFTCITGESYPKDDYEIDSAIYKKIKESTENRRNIDDIDPTMIAGIFDDDGYEINPDLIKKPSLCLTCKNDDDPEEDMLCNMTRHDQRHDEEFICYAYRKK